MPTRPADRFMPTLRRVVLGRPAARTDGELLSAFIADADGEAFAELVRRHGPMVLGVCRRLIPDHGTADDAFQATFLVLARRAAGVRPRERVGNYLYGIAYRTALKARTVLARRRSREKQVDAMPEPTAPPASPCWSDLRHLIDEELARLPEKQRTAVVLCDLEGRAQRDVARQLGVPPATLATRLAAARRTLAARLTRRGVTLSGGALAGLLTAHGSAGAVPVGLAVGVVRAAEALATGGSAHALVSAQAVQLSDGVIHMIVLAKLKGFAVLTAVALALATGLGAGLAPAAADDGPGAPAPKSATAPKPNAGSKSSGAPRPEDDITFLRRHSLDARGAEPTEVENWLFVSDPDAGKRVKVVLWLTEDRRALVGRALDLPLDRAEMTWLGLDADRPLRVWSAAGPEIVVQGRAVRPFVTPLVAALNDGQPHAPYTLAKPTTATQYKYAAWLDNVTEGDRLRASRLAAVSGNDPRVPFRVTLADGRDEKAAELLFEFVATDSDAQFLQRALTDARGTGPTALELKYFTADKDPKKREKLIDELLKDPAVQKKLGDQWRKKVLAPPARPPATAEVRPLRWSTVEGATEYRLQLVDPVVVGDRYTWTELHFRRTAPAAPDTFEKLVSELLAAQKSDEAVLEAVTLAALSRLPTDPEKRLATAALATAKDRKAAWVSIAKALAQPAAKPSPPKKPDAPKP